MNTELKECNWHVGEIVNIPRTETLLKRIGSTSYNWLVGSHYICIRETTESRRGILAKVLGKFTARHIIQVGGQSFSKNDRDILIDGKCFYSYPFPSAKDVKEVLQILRGNPRLLQMLQEASMPIDTESKYWVSETTTRFLIIKKPQCYNALSDSITTASGSDAPYRLTLAYFYNGELTW